MNDFGPAVCILHAILTGMCPFQWRKVWGQHVYVSHPRQTLLHSSSRHMQLQRQSLDGKILQKVLKMIQQLAVVELDCSVVHSANKTLPSSESYMTQWNTSAVYGG